MDWSEACRILGIEESASVEEIKAQYIYKAQLLHPDKNQDKPETIRRKAEAELALVNQAFDFLNDPTHNPYKIPPRLAVEPMVIRFKDLSVGERKSTTLIIRNIGGPYTSVWVDNQPAPWLTVTRVKSITSERLPLEFTLECTGMGEPGRQYTSDLTIKLENESTHTVDQVGVKVELLINPESVMASAAKRVSNTPARARIIPSDQALAQPLPEKTKGFSVKAFLFNLLAFAVIGGVVIYLVFAFLEVSNTIFIIGLIIYAAIAFGVSFNHGFSVGSKIKSPGQDNTPAEKHGCLKLNNSLILEAYTQM